MYAKKCLNSRNIISYEFTIQIDVKVFKINETFYFLAWFFSSEKP